MKSTIKLLYWITLFSVAMGFLESAVVVYLRELYYPQGFSFPLITMQPEIASTEFWREVATLVMLAGIGILTGRNALERFAFFLYSFAIWDLFYYVFLKLLLNWPASLFTWDILFLIPVAWVGPVLAPCLVSITMILFAWLILYFNSKKNQVVITLPEWLLLINGSLIIITSFVLDYLLFVQATAGLSHVWDVAAFQGYMPQQFNWWIFWLGEVVLLTAIGLFARRTITNNAPQEHFNQAKNTHTSSLHNLLTDNK